MSLKQTIHQHFLGLVQQKIDALRALFEDLRSSGANETKSTAGDKHETALAMLQIEQANTLRQLDTVLAMQTILNRLDPNLTPEAIVPGSLVQTNRGYFYLSVALGKQTINGLTVTALSPEAPLGKLLKGTLPGDTVTINSVEYKIEGIS